MPAKEPLTDDEMVEILQDIARSTGNAAARIAAIKALREIQGGDQPTTETFERLDELAPKRLSRTRAA